MAGCCGGANRASGCCGSSSFLVKLTKFVVLVLGLFEFFACYQHWTVPGKNGNVLYTTRDFHEKLLYSTYILTLGLQRLTFVTSCGGVTGLSWLTLIGTHIVEGLFWWSCALERYNMTINASSPVQDVVKTILGKISTPDEYIVLCGVPVLCALFTLAALVDLTSRPSLKNIHEKLN